LRHVDAAPRTARHPRFAAAKTAKRGQGNMLREIRAEATSQQFQWLE